MTIINTIKLRRVLRISEKQHSFLTLHYLENQHVKYINFPVIENRDYLIAPGMYEIEYEYSPKFKEYLWEFKNIKNRSEIKFHNGLNESQSKGCPLMSKGDLNEFHKLLKPNKKYLVEVI